MQSKKTERSYIEILLQSLAKKISVLDRIMEANEEHAKIAVAKDFDPEAFDVVFDKKDELIKELEQLDKGFSTVYTRVKEELLNNKFAYRDEIARMQELIAEITDKSMDIQATEKRNKDGEGTGKYAQATIQVRMSKELKELFEDEAIKTKNKKVRMLRIRTSEFCLMAAASKDKNIDDYVYLYIKDGDVAEEKKSKSKKSKKDDEEDE